MKVAVLGGGMAGLTAAWALSRDCEVTVYEAEWRLGGKGASVRGAHGRVEEHGLHVWLGYYDNAFRLVREVYDELDRARTDPACPIAGWRDAFVPAGHVGVEDEADGEWSHWLARFDGNELEPGVVAGPSGPLSIATIVQRGLRLLLDFAASNEELPEPAPAGVFISASPDPPRAVPVGELARALRQAEVAAMVAAAESLHLLRSAVPGVGSLAPALLDFLDRTAAQLRRDAAARRTWQLADMTIACLRGCVRDELLGRASAFAAIDHLDFREWLARHGAAEETLASPLLRGMYDLVFAYERGDPERPRFSAGLGLFLAAKLFFDYKGAIFWKLRAGMGDVIFAPLYEALSRRGVEFKLGHRVDRLHLEDGRVTAVSLTRDPDERDVLERFKELPCFPARVAEHSEPLRVEDFDAVVLATALGAVPAVCAELLEASPRWREMVENVATVPTQSLQVWARPGEAELGWPHRLATVSAYVSPFDTYASMSHVLAWEDWEEPPLTLGYFCSVLPEAADASAAEANADAFLDGPVTRFWPRFEPAQVMDRYVRANVAPTDRYVQSLPGTGVSRLPANGSGVPNLFLAGDWVACGLDAGCVEAAVLAGLEAANAVRARPLMDGILGTWCGP